MLSGRHRSFQGCDGRRRSLQVEVVRPRPLLWALHLDLLLAPPESGTRRGPQERSAGVPIGPGAGLGEPVGVGSSLDDVAAEGKPVDDNSGAQPEICKGLYPPSASFEAIATLAFSSPYRQNLERQLRAMLTQLHMSKFVDLCRHPHRSTTSGSYPFRPTPPRRSTGSSTPHMRGALWR